MKELVKFDGVRRVTVALQSSIHIHRNTVAVTSEIEDKYCYVTITEMLALPGRELTLNTKYKKQDIRAITLDVYSVLLANRDSSLSTNLKSWEHILSIEEDKEADVQQPTSKTSVPSWVASQPTMSTQLKNILLGSLLPIVEPPYPFLEDIDKKRFLGLRNAGLYRWEEFVRLRGY